MSERTIPARAVALARAEVGTREGARNWSKFARDSYPRAQHQPWCGSFVGDIYRRAGYDSRPHVWMPYVPYIEAWARKLGAWRTDRAQDGDLTVYGFGKRTGQHVGIAWPDESTGGDSYRAIEGNTSSGDAGSQTNGDGVYVRYRRRSQIRGWVDMSAVLKHYGITAPPAKPKPKPKPAPATAPAFPLPRRPGRMCYYGPSDGGLTSVSGTSYNRLAPADVVKVRDRWRSNGLMSWQRQMRDGRGYTITVDGRYGDETERIARYFQELIGEEVDGKIGPKTFAGAWEEEVR